MTELETLIQIGKNCHRHFHHTDYHLHHDHDHIHRQSSIIIRKVLTIEEIVIHPSYDHSGYSFDIALLKVLIVFMFILIMILDVILPELFELVLILRCLMLNLFFAEPS